MLVWVPRLEGQRDLLRIPRFLAHAGLQALRRRKNDLRARVAYEKIEGLRAEIIKEILKGLDL